MLIGIMSDTHGQVDPARKAVALFTRLDAEHIIHCGDVCGVDVLDELVGRPASFVWGNMDQPDGPTLAYLKTVNLNPPATPPLRLQLGGKSFAVFHGHESRFAHATQLDVDYILHGHTHRPRNDTMNGRRIINPGALYRAARLTVATLQTDTDTVRFHEIK